jgi:hypothetical protein
LIILPLFFNSLFEMFSSIVWILYYSCWLLKERCCLIALCFCVGIYASGVIFVLGFQSPMSL